MTDTETEVVEGEILSPAIAALLEIMTSMEVPEPRCLEAAKAIIEFEAPPGVFDLTRDYLMGVANGPDVVLRLEALRLIRKVEARRVVPGTSTALPSTGSYKEAKRYALAKLRMKLRERGEWPPKKGWEEEAVVVPIRPVPVEGLADRLERARTRRLREGGIDSIPQQ